MGFRKTIILILVLIIGFVLLYYFAPSLSKPFINFSVLLLVNIYVWSAISKRVKKQQNILKYALSFLFWLPLLLVIAASVSLLFMNLDEWSSFLRVYFVGGLFAYIFSLIFPVLFLFAADMIRWGQLLFVSKKKNTKRVDSIKGEPISRKKFLVNTGLSLGGLALGTMGFGMLHGNYNFKIWKYQIKINRAPKGLKGLKIVQISDLHLGTWVSKEPLEEVVEYINQLNADLVFFTGDLVNAKTAEALSFASTLGKIHANYGVFASLGNHDYGHYYRWESEEAKQKNDDDLINFYKDINWKLLRNESESIMINGHHLMVVGVENWSLNPRFPQLGDLEMAMKSGQTADLCLLLSHDPTHWDQKVKDFHLPIDVTFSGHTHGFQFGIESSLFRWSPAQYLYKHWAGLYSDLANEKHLNVNRGIGAIGFPGRVGIRPEISFIEIV
ncbi:MAG: metallophosphoesterase [Bacteroidales bacterium]|nr:metallophosphoesterase [Bacteroidales bacterium]